MNVKECNSWKESLITKNATHEIAIYHLFQQKLILNKNVAQLSYLS